MRKIIVIALVLSGIGLVGYNLNKPHRSAAEETGIAVNAIDIFSAFQINEAVANANYLDRTVEVSGKILSLATNADNKTVVTLYANDPLFGINCTLDARTAGLTVADNVTIKGICMGYLSDVVLINCLVVSK